MSSRNYLAVLTILGIQLTTALSLHIPIHRSSNHTLHNLLPSTAATRTNLIFNEDWRVECFDHRVLPISLATCEPSLRELASRPDVDAQHTYGGPKQQRIPIILGPCRINLYGQDYGGITVITYREIIHNVRLILHACEEKRLGGRGYLGLDWWIEVFGALRGAGRVQGLEM